MSVPFGSSISDFILKFKFLVRNSEMISKDTGNAVQSRGQDKELCF